MFLTKNSKSKFYQVVYEKNGKRTSVSTGTTSYKDAKIFLKELIEEDSKQLVSETTQLDLPSTTISLSKLQEEYLDYCKGSKSKSYIRSINLSFKKLVEYTGDINLENLNTRLLDQYISFVSRRSLSGASLYYRTLKAALSKAVVWEYLEYNPLKKIKAPKTVKSFPLFITENELELLTKSMELILIKDIVRVGFYTGLRLGELCNLTWKSVELNTRIITLRNTSTFTTKNKRERVIPISEKIFSIFNSRLMTKSKSHLVFYELEERVYREWYVSRKFKDVVKRLDINQEIHFHTLRHSFASNLAQKGVSLYVIKELMGHEDISTTQIYSHLQQQNLRVAVDLI